MRIGRPLLLRAPHGDDLQYWRITRQQGGRSHFIPWLCAQAAHGKTGGVQYHIHGMLPCQRLHRLQTTG